MNPVLYLLLITTAIHLLLAAPLHGQQIAGKVVNSVNGEPVKRAAVIARAQDAEHGQSYAAETDSHGQFAIADMEPGSYLVSADRQGFHFQARGATGSPPPPLKLDRDQQVLDMVLRLIPLGVIAGRVTDEEGDPISGAHVEALVSAYANGKQQLNQVAEVNSNSNGEYRLFGLTPGTFYVQASLGYMRMQRGPEDLPIRGAKPPEKPALTYYPGVSDAARAAPIEVAAGAELRGFDVQLRRQKTYSAHVKLPSTPGPGRYFYASVSGQPFRGGRYFPQSGGLDVTDLAPGSHMITVVQQEGDKQSYARFTVEIVNGDIDVSAQAFSPAIDVSGVIRADDKKVHPWENIRVALRPIGDTRDGAPSSAVGADGSFVVHHVLPDTYSVTVQFTGSGPQDTYLKAVSVGDHALVDWKIDVTKETTPLSILLGTDVASIEGTVKNAAGEPAVRARVNLIPYGNSTGRADLTKFTFTDEKGEFHFKGAAPAEYRIFAWEDVPIGRPQDPAFRKRFEKQSVLVKIEPNSHQKIEATAISAAEARRP